MSKPNAKNSSSAGGGAAASKPSAPTASSAAPSATVTDTTDDESDTSNPETAVAAPVATSPLDEKTRKIAAKLCEGVTPDQVWGYREYDDCHVLVVCDGTTTVKYTVAK